MIIPDSQTPVVWLPGKLISTGLQTCYTTEYIYFTSINFVLATLPKLSNRTTYNPEGI